MSYVLEQNSTKDELVARNNQAIAHYDTVFSQLLKLIPRHEFETLAKLHVGLNHAGYLPEFVTRLKANAKYRVIEEKATSLL